MAGAGGGQGGAEGLKVGGEVLLAEGGHGAGGDLGGQGGGAVLGTATLTLGLRGHNKRAI